MEENQPSIAPPNPTNIPQPQIPSVVTTVVEEQKNQKSSFPILKILLILILILILFPILVLAGYKMEDKRIVSLPTPTPLVLASPTPSPTPDPTAGWKTFPVLKGDSKPLAGFSFKLPLSLEPTWANAGHYYQTVTLPGNSTLAIILVGQGQGFQWNWEGVQEMVEQNRFTNKTITFINFPAIEFSGTVIPSQSTSLNILGEASGPVRGLAFKINDDFYLEILHYQEKIIAGEKTIDFASDDKTFDQILQTFKFLPETSAVATPAASPSTSPSASPKSGFSY